MTALDAAAPAVPSEDQLRVEAERISELVDEVSAMGGAVLGGRVQELVGRLLHLYGVAMGRMVDMLGGAAAVDAVKARLATDPLVSSLLVLHGVHPDPATARRFDPASDADTRAKTGELVQIDLKRGHPAASDREPNP